MTTARRQSGATLIVVLIMLTVLTLFAIAAINLSGANLRVVGNLQARKQVESFGLQAAEQIMSSMAYFNAPGTAASFTSGNTTATISKRVCQWETAASGYSAVQPIVPIDTQWDFRVRVEDSFTNAKATFWQGTKIRMLAGGCAANLSHD
jgi:Tfp pilus assembly protein PilX